MTDFSSSYSIDTFSSVWHVDINDSSMRWLTVLPSLT